MRSTSSPCAPTCAACCIRRKAPTVFTPHPGEAAHLLACSTEEVQKDRAAAVRELARRLGGSVVLKGAGSLCVTRDGKLHINQTGNPGMSSAGMGDVLSGMIAAFIAQGLSADEALLLGVHLHGAAGDELATSAGHPGHERDRSDRMGALAAEPVDAEVGIARSATQVRTLDLALAGTTCPPYQL